MNLDPTFKAAWLEELRLRNSPGDQCHRRLFADVSSEAGITEYGACCALGAAGIAAQRLGLAKIAQSPVTNLYQIVSVAGPGIGQRDACKLPVSLAAYVGLDLEDMHHIMKLNDTEGRTLAEIADFIEAKL